MKKKIISLIITISLFITLFAGCGGYDSTGKTGFYFDTLIQITLYGSSDESIIDECFELADKYEKMLSATISGSEISTINANAGIAAVEVSSETLALIKKGIEYGDLSQGAFDITIGPLSSLWNISELAENCQDENNQIDASLLPSDEEIKSALSLVDYKKIQIDGNKVYLTKKGMQIDLGGIAKGYIADRMKDLLIEKNIDSAIINLGGNIVTIGKKPDGNEFKIGIQKPFAETGEYITTVSATNKSVVTSGMYERYVTVGSQTYGHILSTNDGYPIKTDLMSTTVICDSSIDADALSTICFCKGSDAAIDLINSIDDAELIIVDSDYSLEYSKGL